MSGPALFGFALDAPFPLRFARDGGGVERLTIREGPANATPPESGFLVEWPLQGSEQEVIAGLYERPGGFEYWTTDAGRFAVDVERGVIEVPPMDDVILREQRLNGIPLALAYTARGDIALHAAAVEIDGGAVLLAAPSRFGKTTLAMAFHAQDYAMLAEDLVAVRVGTREVLPGPAVIRLRADVYSGSPPAGLEEVARRGERVFLSPPVGQRGSAAARRLKAIVFLREAESIRVERASPIAAVKDLWHLNFRLPSAQAREQSFRALSDLVGRTPVWDLHRPFRLDALEQTVQAIVGCGSE